MTTDPLAASFRNQIGREFELVPDGPERYWISGPFDYGDGDCLEITLEKRGDRWHLTDHGTTFMRLSTHLDGADRNQGSRREVVAGALAAGGVEDRDGELVLPVPEGGLGVAVFAFIQAILEVNSLSLLSRERVASMFHEDEVVTS